MHFIKTRILSFLFLCTMVAGCGYVGSEGYYAVFNDSWVAPAILSPDNDLVIDAKLKYEQLSLEQGKSEAQLAEANADLEAGEKAISELDALKEVAINALTWNKTTTGQQVSLGSADLGKLAEQKETLNQMLTRQALIVDTSKRNLEAGLVQKPDLDREVQAMDQIQIALFENQRTQMQSSLLLTQAAMGQQALYNRAGGKLFTPEQIMSQDQLVRITCQRLETEATMRTQKAEKEKLEEELKEITKLKGELLARPIFHAIQANIDVAFAPYSALRGITKGGHVMSCLWSVVNCREVGKVSDIIPGESILPDPFSSMQTRGQFIVLDLNKDERDLSMKSKTLRIR